MDFAWILTTVFLLLFCIVGGLRTSPLLTTQLRPPSGLRTSPLLTTQLRPPIRLPGLSLRGTPSPSCYVLLNNLQSGSNIGAICRNALAFNVSEVVVVGRPNWNEKMRMADRGAKRLLKFVNFPSSALAAAYLKEQKNCKILGLEICEGAVNLSTYEWEPNTNVCFVFGNEGAGLSEGQRKMCDSFIYIPQYSSGLASINVACVSAIALHAFAQHSKYTESTRRPGLEKFL